MSYTDLTADERVEVVASRAELKYGKYASLHEAYAVLHEECDELGEACDDNQFDKAESLDYLLIDMWESVKANNLHSFLENVRQVAKVASTLTPTSVAMEGEMIDVAAVCSRIIKQWQGALVTE